MIFLEYIVEYIEYFRVYFAIFITVIAVKQTYIMQ